MAQILNARSAAITTSGSGDKTIIAAIASTPLRIWAIDFTVDGATNVIFKDGASTSLSGAEILTAAGSSVSKIYTGMPYWYVSPGNAFIINSSAAQALIGQVFYTTG